MKKLMPTLFILGAVALILFSAAGGALADRLFVIRPLDAIFPRSQSPLTRFLTSSTQSSQGNDESTVIDVADTSRKRL